MNLRASAIVMKSLPATAWGDALLISREEARRIGYELEQAADRIEALEASATPALPQAEHDLEDVRCQCCGYMTYHSEHMGCIRSAYKQALPQVPEGMAIVPVEPTPKMIVAFRNSNGFQDGYKAMLAAAKEQSK